MSAIVCQSLKPLRALHNFCGTYPTPAGIFNQGVLRPRSDLEHPGGWTSHTYGKYLLHKAHHQVMVTMDR